MWTGKIELHNDLCESCEYLNIGALLTLSPIWSIGQKINDNLKDGKGMGYDCYGGWCSTGMAERPQISSESTNLRWIYKSRVKEGRCFGGGRRTLSFGVLGGRSSDHEITKEHMKSLCG